MKILTPGFFCLVTFFLLFFTNETRSIWRGWLNWSSSKARSIGRCFLHWLGECKMSLTRKQGSLRVTDQVVPASVNRLTHDLSSYVTRATTVDEDQHGRTNDIVTTHNL
jgi:hypothetical protein